MSIVIGIDNRNSDPYSLSEMKRILQDAISTINKDLLETYIEEQDAAGLDRFSLLYEFKDWFLNWKIFEDSDCLRDLTFYKIYSDGEIESLEDYCKRDFFQLEDFSWDFSWWP